SHVDHNLLSLVRESLMLQADEDRLDSAPVLLGVGDEASVGLGLGPTDLLNRHVRRRDERTPSAANGIIDLGLADHDTAAIGSGAKTVRQEPAVDQLFDRAARLSFRSRIELRQL